MESHPNLFNFECSVVKNPNPNTRMKNRFKVHLRSNGYDIRSAKELMLV